MKRPLHRLRIPDGIAELVRRMHPDLKRKTRASMKTILADPSSGKALKDELAGLRSFRVGTFRIIYRGKRNIVEIVAIGPRERIHEETYRLLKREIRETCDPRGYTAQGVERGRALPAGAGTGDFRRPAPPPRSHRAATRRRP
jgi:mRNA interferase RelE/StbE